MASSLLTFSSSVAQDFVKNPLQHTDFLRYTIFHTLLQQRIASSGAASYLGTDALGLPTFVAPDITTLLTQSTFQNTRFAQYMHYNIDFNQKRKIFLDNQLANQLLGQPGFDLNNINWAAANTAEALLLDFSYDPAIENQQQRFLADSLISATKTKDSMVRATGAVFEWLLKCVDANLGNRIIAIQSRTGAGTSPHTNLINSILMLTREMEGNPLASREQAVEVINRLKPASTIEGFVFCLNSMCSVHTVISASILLHKGNGLPSNSQWHHKHLSKIDPSSPILNFIRLRLLNILDTTEIHAIRDLLKSDLDRELLCFPSRSSSSSLPPLRLAHFATPDATDIYTFHAMVDEYNAVEGGPLTFPSPALLASDTFGPAHNAYTTTHQGSNNWQDRPPSFPRVCHDYLFGQCRRPACQYSHPSLNDLPAFRHHSPSATSNHTNKSNGRPPSNLPNRPLDGDRGRGRGRGPRGIVGNRKGSGNGGRSGNSGRGPSNLGKRSNPSYERPSSNQKEDGDEN